MKLFTLTIDHNGRTFQVELRAESEQAALASWEESNRMAAANLVVVNIIESEQS